MTKNPIITLGPLNNILSKVSLCHFSFTDPKLLQNLKLISSLWDILVWTMDTDQLTTDKSDGPHQVNAASKNFIWMIKQKPKSVVTTKISIYHQNPLQEISLKMIKKIGEKMMHRWITYSDSWTRQSSISIACFPMNQIRLEK